MSSSGYNQTEICQRLQLDKSTVNRDIAFLRKQAKQDLQKHIHETVPEEYQRCMIGMKRTLKQILEISESAADPRTKLQAHAIAIDIYKNIMDLATNGVVVNDALRIIQSKINILNGVNVDNIPSKKDEIITEDELKGEEDKTTNGVF